MDSKCSICGGKIVQKYKPMEEWKTEGILCSKCYSKKIAEHYPGKHVRMNSND